MTRNRPGAIIERLAAREILDSRGVPTIEVSMVVAGNSATASVPSGKSTGRFEAVEKRDGDPARFAGKGVLAAVESVATPIAQALVGARLPDQHSLDRMLCELDGTPNKQRLGANAILGVSLAAARVRAILEERPLYESISDSEATLLPVPCFNVINGGAHADNALDFQEFMVVPAGFGRYSDALRAGAETYHALATLLEAASLSTAVGDEGGFAPAIDEPDAALDLLMRAIEKAGYRPGLEIGIALDPAASAFFHDGHYRVAGKGYDAAGMTNMYADWLARYPILSIEDGLAEDDAPGWQHLTRTLGSRTQLVGDDIFVSSPERIRGAIDQRIANAVLLKPNQIGTLSEIIETVAVAGSAGYNLMMSHRSGETDDSFIADLAVALGTGQIKAGAPARGERLAKYNQLLRIEESLGDRACFGGLAVFARQTT